MIISYFSQKNKEMKKVIIFLAVATFYNILYSQKPDSSRLIAKNVLSFFPKNEFEKIPAFFDENLKQNLLSDKLGSVWKSLEQQFGTFEKTSNDSIYTMNNYLVVDIYCIFKNGRLIFKTSYDKNGKIAGIFFVPDPGKHK